MLQCIALGASMVRWREWQLTFPWPGMRVFRPKTGPGTLYAVMQDNHELYPRDAGVKDEGFGQNRRIRVWRNSCLPMKRSS